MKILVYIALAVLAGYVGGFMVGESAATGRTYGTVTSLSVVQSGKADKVSLGPNQKARKQATPPGS